MATALDMKILITLFDVMETIVSIFLEESGYRNVERRPEDADAFLKSYRPGECELIISQPTRTQSRLDGLALLSEVRKRDKTTRFLVLSGSPQDRLEEFLRRDGLDLGDWSYLAIPFDQNQLSESVHRALLS
jgi:DNA-binding NtrC family response regulator